MVSFVWQPFGRHIMKNVKQHTRTSAHKAQNKTWINWTMNINWYSTNENNILVCHSFRILFMHHLIIWSVKFIFIWHDEWTPCVVVCALCSLAWTLGQVCESDRTVGRILVVFLGSRQLWSLSNHKGWFSVPDSATITQLNCAINCHYLWATEHIHILTHLLNKIIIQKTKAKGAHIFAVSLNSYMIIFLTRTNMKWLRVDEERKLEGPGEPNHIDIILYLHTDWDKQKTYYEFSGISSSVEVKAKLVVSTNHSMLSSDYIEHQTS